MSGAEWLESTKVRVREWFEKNPDEYLMVKDIAIKFGCCYSRAAAIVGELRAAGVVTAARAPADRRFVRVQLRGRA